MLDNNEEKQGQKRERDRSYYLRNREKILPKMREYNSKYYLENREKILEYKRLYRLANPEKVNDNCKRSKEKNQKAGREQVYRSLGRGLKNADNPPPA